MAKRRGLLLAGIAAGAFAYLRNPENRRKATIAFNNAKLKVNDFMESQNLEEFEEATSKGSSSATSESTPAKPRVQYYNEDKTEA
ncbi:hypothetical protein [Planococcus sp. YIM B11945]|uniref:hypothetical protein n=1 Tax=Planococcus sp. YIM B11945 TaxID=3435410 RepID=UPI003D7C48CA